MSATDLAFGDWVMVKDLSGKKQFIDRLSNIVHTKFGDVYYTAKNKNPLPIGYTVTYEKYYYKLE